MLAHLNSLAALQSVIIVFGSIIVGERVGSKQLVTIYSNYLGLLLYYSILLLILNLIVLV